MRDLNEHVFAHGYKSSLYLTSDTCGFPDGDKATLVTLTIDVGGEDLSLSFDEYHLRKLRLAVQRAERWLKSQSTDSGVTT